MIWRRTAARISVTALSVLLVGGCSAGSGKGGGSDPSQSPAPKAVSVEEYSTMLAGPSLSDRLGAEAFGRSQGVQGLDGQLAGSRLLRAMLEWRLKIDDADATTRSFTFRAT